MADFERPCVCERCGREYVVRGTSANPSNETQAAVTFTCACGAEASVMLPGSVNRERIRIEPQAE